MFDLVLFKELSLSFFASDHAYGRRQVEKQARMVLNVGLYLIQVFILVVEGGAQKEDKIPFFLRQRITLGKPESWLIP